ELLAAVWPAVRSFVRSIFQRCCSSAARAIQGTSSEFQQHGERGVGRGGERGVRGAVPGAARWAGAPLRGVQDRRLAAAGGGGRGGAPGRRLRRAHRQPPRRRLPLRRLRPRLHRRRRRSAAGRGGGGAAQQDRVRGLGPGHRRRAQQDGVRQLLRGLQEGARRRAGRHPGHRPQRAHARRAQGAHILATLLVPWQRARTVCVHVRAYVYGVRQRFASCTGTACPGRILGSASIPVT
ncbi:hypothetical protein U9M48_010989, partial [Paspalum notatum var. saurae]